MATVTALASHLLTLLQPVNSGATNSVAQVDAARLAFYHFLKNLCEPGEPLSTSILDRFFRRSMTHAHWVDNKTALFDEVTNALQHFSNQHSETVPLPPFSSPEDLQVVRAESFRTLERIVEDWIQRHQGPTEQFKIIRDRDERIVVCRLGLDRALSVFLFDRLLCLREGRLEPLTDDMAIHYTAELAIDPFVPSQLEISPHSIARFKNDGTVGGLRGLAVRGFTFQKSAAFDGGEIHRHPILFYPLKRIEQFFVNRATDPMYTELTGLLEKASDLVSQKHPEAIRFAEAAMERGRLAFDQVFVDDRMLRLLLENLERALLLERRPLSQPANERTVELAPQVGDKLGIQLNPGEEFIEEDYGPDLVELQKAEICEKIAPINQPVPNPPMT